MARVEFELTKHERKELLKATKPQPVMYLPGGRSMFRNSQEIANEEWAKLGVKHGFDSTTVEPVNGKDDCFFTAEVVGDGETVDG